MQKNGGPQLPFAARLGFCATPSFRASQTNARQRLSQYTAMLQIYACYSVPATHNFNTRLAFASQYCAVQNRKRRNSSRKCTKSATGAFITDISLPRDAVS
jgi:hypothetical protein